MFRIPSSRHARMIFAEEMSYFGGPTFQPNPATAGAPTGGGQGLGRNPERYQNRTFGVPAGGMGPPPSMEPWKGGVGSLGPAGTSAGAEFVGGGGYMGGGVDSGGSKLITKWGGHPMDYGKQQHQMHQQQATDSGSGGMSPFTPTGVPPYGGAPWNEAPHHHPGHQMNMAGHGAPFAPMQFQPAPQDALAQAESKFSQLNLKAPAFQPAGLPQQAPSGLFTPPVDLVNGQWGRAEINQATPWNMEMNGVDPNQQGPPAHPRYRKWDQQRVAAVPQDDGGPFGPGGYVGPIGTAGGYGMHMYGGGGMERMMPGGMPQFGGGRGPPMNNRGWDPSGGGNKFGGTPTDLSGGGGGSHRNAPSGLFSGPPPPLHSMSMMPPRHPPMFGHMPPPPLLTALNPPHAGGGAQFGAGGIGQFGGMQNGTAGGMQQAGLNEDSIWQDPNGELRKWQRDTGTSIWGDPAKQANNPIQRWQQFTADEVVAKSNLLVKEGGNDMVESGWGELPPIGANANGNNGGGAAGNNGGTTMTTTAPTLNGGGQHQFGTTTTTTGQTQGKGPSSRNGWNNAGGEAGGGAGTGTGWNDQNPTGPGQQSGTVPSFQQPSGTFVLPPATTASGSGQPPSLLAMIDTNKAESGAETAQRKSATTSPGQPQQQQQGTTATGQQQQSLKVSLAEELSSLGPHGMGSGIW